MYQPVGEELGDQVLGLVGLGASGRELAARARCLGMRIKAVDVCRHPGAAASATSAWRASPAWTVWTTCWRTSDIVSLHVPLTGETTHLIDERRLRLMKPTARLINVARGRMVDEDALVGALRERAARGAGIDVFGEEPLTAATTRSCSSTTSWRRRTPPA